MCSLPSPKWKSPQKRTCQCVKNQENTYFWFCNEATHTYTRTVYAFYFNFVWFDFDNIILGMVNFECTLVDDIYVQTVTRSILDIFDRRASCMPPPAKPFLFLWKVSPQNSQVMQWYIIFWEILWFSGGRGCIPLSPCLKKNQLSISKVDNLYVKQEQS